MNKLKNGTLYTGNITKNVNNNQVIIEENAMLIYDELNNCFYNLKVLNYLLDLETNQNLSIETRTEHERIVAENTYPYCLSRDDSSAYIDENSIKEFAPNNKKR